MPDLSRSELAAYAVCALLVAVLGWHALRSDAGAGTRAASSPGGARSAVAVRRGTRTALVHVTGAVRRPGVYRLPEGARVQDAVRRAGGARRGADVQALNLAAKVADAQQVVVPTAEAAGATSAGVAASAGAMSPAGGPAAPVNLNSATAEQLDALDGVGPATAQKILEYRIRHGGFRSVDDLGNVPGIGPKRLAALREKVQA